jgi:hypothetical protein
MMRFLIQVHLSSFRSLQVPPTDTAMQLLNTDFNSPDRGEYIEMSAIHRFTSQLQLWESTSGVDCAGACVKNLAPEGALGNAVKSHIKLSGGRVSNVWYHSCILAERMALNYSR